MGWKRMAWLPMRNTAHMRSTTDLPKTSAAEVKMAAMMIGMDMLLLLHVMVLMLLRPIITTMMATVIVAAIVMVVVTNCGNG